MTTTDPCDNAVAYDAANAAAADAFRAARAAAAAAYHRGVAVYLDALDDAHREYLASVAQPEPAPSTTARAEELVQALNGYTGADWWNDIAADYDDIIDYGELDGPDGHRYRTDRLPISGGGVVEPSGHTWVYSV